MTERSRLRPSREFDLIERMTSALGEHPDVVLGVGDDCAILRNGFAISVDTSVEGIHFKREWLSPIDIGYRAAAVAISDLAAMAAQPSALLVALSLPADDYGAFAIEIADGINQCALASGAMIAGGDTTRSQALLAIGITAIGIAEQPVLRAGAQVGDALWVTGQLGAAAAAVDAWLTGQEAQPAHIAAFRRPPDRTRAARWLQSKAELHAMIDLSDGLAGDAGHIAAASAVGIIVEVARLPIAPGANARLALNGGDDYELCFAAPAASIEAVQNDFKSAFGCDLTRVGTVVSGSGVRVIGADGESVDIGQSYDHFEDKTQ